MKTIYKLGMLLICLWAIGACSESTKLMYGNDAKIYFHLPEKDSLMMIKGDTVTYSFAFVDPEQTEQTLYIPVEISGFRHEFDRFYQIGVMDEYSTAIPDEDYKRLDLRQVLRAKVGRDSLAVRLYRSAVLRKEVRNIQIRLTPTDDFQLGPQEHLFVNIRFSDILEEPEWWERWSYYFGPYHRIKYEEWIKIWGGTGDLTGKNPTPYYSPNEIMAIMELKEYFEKHPRYTLEELGDRENMGERIFVPCPLN